MFCVCLQEEMSGNDDDSSKKYSVVFLKPFRQVLE